MDTILDFLVDNYIWVLVISIFLIVVLIGYIADQKKKLKKMKGQEVQVTTNNNVNVPVQEETQNVNVAPNPVVSEPVVNNVTDTIETPSFEPISVEVNAPIAEAPVSETLSPLADEPIVETSIVEEPINNLQNEPIFEETPQTILDIPDNVSDIEVPSLEEIETTENNEVINEPEIIEEIIPEQNVVNSWEPEITTENKDINNENEIKDSI